MEAMEVVGRAEARSADCGPKPEHLGLDLYQLGGDIRSLMAVLPETGSSFTALLELPPNKAVELLVRSPEAVNTPPPLVPPSYLLFPQPLGFPSTSAGTLLDRAAKFSVFSSSRNSPTSSWFVKQESADSDADRNSLPAVSQPTVQKPSHKRKDKAQKAKESNKKSKKAADETLAEDSGGEKLPLIHLRAPRGQATNSHSLAERARREKINARMKLLQEIVPGCEKISGTASVLDVIINHVQSLQSQVEVRIRTSCIRLLDVTI